MLAVWYMGIHTVGAVRSIDNQVLLYSVYIHVLYVPYVQDRGMHAYVYAYISVYTACSERRMDHGTWCLYSMWQGSGYVPVFVHVCTPYGVYGTWLTTVFVLRTS